MYFLHFAQADSISLNVDAVSIPLIPPRARHIALISHDHSHALGRKTLPDVCGGLFYGDFAWNCVCVAWPMLRMVFAGGTCLGHSGKDSCACGGSGGHFDSRTASCDIALVSRAASVYPRRFQLPSWRGYICARPTYQSHACDVGPFRNHPCRYGTEVHDNVLSRSRRLCSQLGQDIAGKSMVRRRILVSGCSTMCAGLCWMLQAWLPPGWALLGGMIAVLRLGLFSYWMNTYTGGGFISALGGALVLGSLPRLTKTARFRYGLLMAFGIVLLVLTRPVRGHAFMSPGCGFFGAMGFPRKEPAKPNSPVSARCVTPSSCYRRVLLPGLGYYDYRAFGKPPLTLPYTVNQGYCYAIAPYYVMASATAEPNNPFTGMNRSVIFIMALNWRALRSSKLRPASLGPRVSKLLNHFCSLRASCYFLRS